MSELNNLNLLLHLSRVQKNPHRTTRRNISPFSQGYLCYHSICGTGACSEQRCLTTVLYKMKLPDWTSGSLISYLMIFNFNDCPLFCPPTQLWTRKLFTAPFSYGVELLDALTHVQMHSRRKFFTIPLAVWNQA